MLQDEDNFEPRAFAEQGWARRRRHCQRDRGDRRQNERDECKGAWPLDTAKAVIEQFKVPLPLQYSEFTLKLQKLPARAEVMAEETLPLEYCRVIPEHREADKKKLLADLKPGVVIRGARLAAPACKLTIK